LADPAAAATVGSVQTSGAASPAGVTLVAPAAAAKLLGSGETIAVIDVRTPTEFAAGHLSGAMNIDVNGPTFETDIADLDKDATYFVYCHSGRRSAVATQAMSDRGFTAVYELDGGIEAWLAAGQQVVAG
jgi:rhodanese-related sulfurtransferase